MYKIEIRLASKNGWHTPAEARAYYGKYARNGVTWHWWNSPDKVQDSDHDNIANYLLGRAQRAQSSVNYILSNKKITMLVNPDNVAWASQSGNPTTISVELSPHLNAEGYKKAGWLFNELEGRYGKTLKHYPHNYWVPSTACPGSISINRIKQEAAKWKNGAYDPQPEWLRNRKPESERILFAIDDKTPLCNLNNVSEHIKNFKKGTPFEIAGRTTVNGNPYWITKSSMGADRAAGLKFSDLQATDPTAPVPPPEEPTNTFKLWKDGGHYVANKQPTYLYDLTNTKDWGSIKRVGSVDKGTIIQIVGGVYNRYIDREYYIEMEKFTAEAPIGFHPADLDIYTPPTDPVEPPTDPVEPTDPDPVPEPEQPEYPQWFIDFWMKLVEAIKNIFNRGDV